MNNDSEIIVTEYATVFIGADAVNMVRAAHLAGALLLYGRTKMLMTRDATPTLMLNMAKGYTGKVYKGADKYLIAAADVFKWVEVMHAAIPVTMEGDE